MRISTITVHAAAGWPQVSLPPTMPQLTAIYGPPNSGKTAMAGLIGHALFGKSDSRLQGATGPDGELIVETSGGRYRLRRYQDAHQAARLTVAALGGAPIDQHTIRKLTGGLSPVVLGPLCAVSFREPPSISRLLSQEFAQAFQLIGGERGTHGTRRTSELAARRDLLAQELETRIAGERRASKDLESRWRELDRLVREEQQQGAALDQRLKAVETSLAETDSRLRYRRLELNVELRWRSDENHPVESPPAELDVQIGRCRQTLAELSERESVVRARLAQIQAGRTGSAAALADQQTWLAVSRQLSADLTGEVARLARASASRQCVCHDAHPRLRPIAETIERQLTVLEKSIDDQRRAVVAADLDGEVDDLLRSQAELRRHLEHLLERRQATTFGAVTARDDASGAKAVYSAVDAEQLEGRRLELEQERFRLVEQLRSAARKLKVLRGERDTIERQRAALLSARSIEHVQRELASVQQKLEQAATVGFVSGEVAISDDYPVRASDYLAQLTNGELVRLLLVDQGRKACVVNRAGTTVVVDSLSGAQQDQVYLSLCLALLSAASGHGAWLPLVLDEPFERLDASGTAALAAVLDSFCRQGHQVLVFTGQKEAVERLASVGAAMHDIVSLRRKQNADVPAATIRTRPVIEKKRKNEARQRKKKASPEALSGESSDSEHSDAA